MRAIRHRLGFLAVVVLCLVGTGAPSASAADFFAQEYAAEIKGETTETQTLSLGELKVQCKKASLAGEMLDESEAITVGPTYTSCTAAGLSATVEAKGCSYVLHLSTETSENVFSGTNDVACSKEQTIKVVAFSSKCEAKIGAQTGLSSVTYQGNASEPPDTTLKQNLGAMHYTVTKDEGTCPLAGTGEKTNGTLVGNLPLKAYSEAKQVGMVQKKEANAKLCSEMPAANGTCPAGKAFKGTPIQGVSNAGVPSPVTLNLISKGMLQDSISCEQSVLTAETSVETGSPRLTAEKVAVSFGACKDFVFGNACEIEMTNAPTTGNISAPPPGQRFWGGVLRIAMTLSVECGAKIQCVYGTAQENIAMFGGPSELLAERVRPFTALEGAACDEQLAWLSRLEVLEPAVLWVTM